MIHPFNASSGVVRVNAAVRRGGTVLGGQSRAEGLAVQSRDEGGAEGMCSYSSIEGCVEMVLLRGIVRRGGGNFLGERL